MEEKGWRRWCEGREGRGGVSRVRGMALGRLGRGKRLVETRLEGTRLEGTRKEGSLPGKQQQRRLLLQQR